MPIRGLIPGHSTALAPSPAGGPASVVLRPREHRPPDGEVAGRASSRPQPKRSTWRGQAPEGRAGGGPEISSERRRKRDQDRFQDRLALVAEFYTKFSTCSRGRGDVGPVENHDGAALGTRFLGFTERVGVGSSLCPLPVVGRKFVVRGEHAKPSELEHGSTSGQGPKRQSPHAPQWQLDQSLSRSVAQSSSGAVYSCLPCPLLSTPKARY